MNSETLQALVRCDPFDSDGYWAAKAINGPALKPLQRPCHDCAVVYGMYRPFSDDLSKQPSDIIEACTARWFCHNKTSRACAGNIEHIASLKALSLREKADGPTAA